jgi:UDP-GlcNAc:undecaprenyl-phosphate GlcNAc-1-phosphate transferase
MTVDLAVACVIAAVGVVVLVPPVGGLARQVGAVAWPRADRWHRAPVPTIGGLAIAAGLGLGAIVLARSQPILAPFALAVAAMTLVGLIDDLRGLPPAFRLLAEAAIGVGFVLTIPVDAAPLVVVLGVALAAIAFPFAANATNLVDNADGLAAALSVVTALVLLLGGLSMDADGAISTSPLVAATSAAFLLYNRPPARIFMGDCGSLTVGVALGAASALLLASAVAEGLDRLLAASAITAAAWAVQAGDVMLVVVTRRRRGAPLLQGGVDHTSHRLMASGLSPTMMVVALVALAAAVGGSVLAAAAAAGGWAAVAVAGVGIAGVGLVERQVATIPVALPERQLVEGEVGTSRQGSGDS